MTGEITRAASPAGESALGDLIADAQLAATSPSVKGGAVVMMVMTLTGEMLKQVLEQQFDNSSAALLQVSKGFAYSYRLSAPSGQRVDPTSIRINGRVISPSEKVRVAVSDFLADGARFTVFKKGTNRLGGDIDIDAFVAYFQTHSPVSAGPQNRITKIDEGLEDQPLHSTHRRAARNSKRH